MPGLNQSSRFVEDEIDRLLKEGIKSKLDVVHILAWKVGRIAHLGSESKFAYTDDWANAEEFEVTLRKNKFDIKKMVDYIVSNIKALEEKAANDPQGVLCDLESVRAVGFGPVYLITLLYFISRGKYPIYDRFAMMAVDAIIAGTKPGNTVVYCELPSKDSKEFNTIMQDHMIPYIQKLDKIFGDEYQKSRDIDRALWAYGHLFIGTKRISSKIIERKPIDYHYKPI